jgi:hypothetical protein
MTRRGRPADAAGDGHARYLASVYRDVRLLTWSATDLQSMLDRVYWVYHSARPLFNLRCRSNFDAFRPEMLEPSDRDGASHIALLQHAPNLIHRMSWFGFWLHSRLPMPLKLHQNAEAQLGTGWIADHAWAEVMRIAPTWRIGEGGNYGCWFEVSAGSGIALNVGRSLRARNRAHLVAMLGANITRIFERPVQGKLHAWQTARMNGNWTNDPKTAPALFSNLSISDEVGLRQRYFENYRARPEPHRLSAPHAWEWRLQALTPCVFRCHRSPRSVAPRGARRRLYIGCRPVRYNSIDARDVQRQAYCSTAPGLRDRARQLPKRLPWPAQP